MAPVIYEEQCYKKMEKKFKQTLSLHSMITYVLEEKETTPSNDAAIWAQSASATDTNVGTVNGLAWNDTGW